LDFGSLAKVHAAGSIWSGKQGSATLRFPLGGHPWLFFSTTTVALSRSEKRKRLRLLMKETSKRLRFCGRKISKCELQLIHAFGAESAWMNAADRTSDPQRWRSLLREFQPWKGTPPNLCKVHEGNIVLIHLVLIRVPDEVNQLVERKTEQIFLDPRKNLLTERTKWIFLPGRKVYKDYEVTYSTKRGYGQPRQKVIPF
jgi:hypothetical protein